jgi:hypothetical protein
MLGVALSTTCWSDALVYTGQDARLPRAGISAAHEVGETSLHKGAQRLYQGRRAEHRVRDAQSPIAS